MHEQGQSLRALGLLACLSAGSGASSPGGALGGRGSRLSPAEVDTSNSRTNDVRLEREEYKTLLYHYGLTNP